MEERVMEICEDLCCKELTTDEQLVVSGLLSSFKIMELICSLEEEYHIKFIPEEITNPDNFACVNSIVAIVNTKILREKEKTE